MKKLLAIVLTACLLFSLTSCFGLLDDPIDTDPIDPVPDEPDVKTDLTGVWNDDESMEYLLIYEDKTWAKVFMVTESVYEGTYEENGEGGLKLFCEEFCDDGYEEVNLTGEGKLQGEEGAYFSYLCNFEDDLYTQLLSIIANIQMPTPYFEQMGYEINYDLGMGGEYVKKGAYAHSADETQYATIPATVSLREDSRNDTQDGYVEIEVTKIVYLDRAYYPDFMFTGKWNIGLTTNIYDYYTGEQLPDTAVNGDTDRGDNYYYFEYESQGRTIKVDYNYSTKWTQEEDKSHRFEMQIFFRMPADYDGIVIGNLEAYDSMAECKAARSDPGETRPIISEAEAEGALFCRVNAVG